jgi:hypothetical protein
MQPLLLLALVARLVLALQLTAPGGSAILSKGQTVTVSWNSVTTDPTSFGLFLVNYVTYPPLAIEVASDVQTSAGSIQVTIPCDIRTDSGFQM